MSVPLDRLYHYLRSFCGDDVIIYRFYPHGSKNLNNIIDLYELQGQRSTDIDVIVFVGIIFHDQEPLNYDYYTSDDCLQYIKDDIAERRKHPPVAYWCDNEDFLKQLAQSHLRIVIKQHTNLHDCVLLCHSEKNSPELARYEQNNFIGVYYWSHGLIARDWFRYAQYDGLIKFDPVNIVSDFLIYNRAWSGTREYRLKFAELLVDQQLLPHCNTKFSAYDQTAHYSNHNYKNPAFRIHRQDLETLFEKNIADSQASADYDSEDYRTAGIEVVLETLFDDPRQHLTEKSLRPIACGKPFLLAATAGSLEYIRSYGFKTFAPWINEDYDAETDPVKRLELIVAEMKRICALDQTSKQQLWSQLYQIADFNKQHFFSAEFQDTIVNEFKNNVDHALKKCRQHVSGYWFDTIADMESHDPEAVARKQDKLRRAREYLRTKVYSA